MYHSLIKRNLLCRGIISLLCAITLPATAQNFLLNPTNTNGLQDPYTQSLVLRDGDKPGDIIQNNIFIKIVVSKNTCFVGEPIFVDYLLYAAIRNQSKMNRPPVFTGCSVMEMTNPEEPARLEKIKNKVYKIFSFRKVQLTPLQEGDLIIDTVSLHTEVGFSAPNNPLDVTDYSANIISNIIHVQVKPLPTNDKPMNFSGIIGKFQISANVDSIRISAGENNNLHIVISGQGNLDGITQPTVNWPEGIEHFDGSDSQHIDKSNFPSSGEKLFTIPFIGTKEGSYTIPKISYSFFDPQTQTYVSLESDSIPVNITHALPKHEEMKEIVPEDITNRKYLWIIPAIALTVSFIWIISSRKKTPPAVSTLLENAIPDNILAQTESTDFNLALQQLTVIDDNQLFFRTAKKILTKALQEMLHTDIVVEQELIQLMEKKLGFDHGTLAKDIYAICNLHLYAPVIQDVTKQALLNQLYAFVELMPK